MLLETHQSFAAPVRERLLRDSFFLPRSLSTEGFEQPASRKTERRGSPMQTCLHKRVHIKIGRSAFIAYLIEKEMQGSRVNSTSIALQALKQVDNHWLWK